MSDSSTPTDKPAKRPGRRAVLIGLGLAPIAAGGGYVAATSGVLPLGASSATHDAPVEPLQVAFVPVDPLIISIGRGSDARHLRFQAQLEVVPARAAEVAGLMPRVVDVLNGYLRAVAMRDLEDPSSLVRLRAQMLRRVQIVTGDGAVRDLLIMEFVVS
ncbi:flagellar basal body-associated FliL family protein [Palleronia sp. KMU-117]|uniref:flagellar basal body-associated FliL family protein n=1 Tax=Palleronia sp. KMU-117 TaxID=3434108 RepID=UPI003D7024CF